MKRLLAALVFLSLVTPAYAQQTKAALVTEVNTNWPDNTTGAITPALLRNTVIDIINSYLDLTTFGTGLTQTATAVNSDAAAFLTFSTGYITSIASASGKAFFSKVENQSTVDNVVGGAGTAYTCTATPTISMFDCGTNARCSAPTTITSFTITGANIAYVATSIAPTITAGDFIAWALTGGACTNVNIRATSQIHSN